VLFYQQEFISVKSKDQPLKRIKMNPAAPYIFPGALLGSLILALFAFTVTSGMALPASFTQSETGLSSQVSVEAAPESGTGVEEGLVEEVQTQEEMIESEDDEEATDCEINSGFPEKVLRWCDQITKFSEKNDLDPNLVAALVLQESGGNPNAYSKSGAVGLMQVMPRDGLAAGFSCVNGPCFANRPSIDQLEDPNFNLRYGTNMLAGLIDKHGDVREALKAYGPMNVGYYYADIVLGLYRRYTD
jgi:hypothetical protein